MATDAAAPPGSPPRLGPVAVGAGLAALNSWLVVRAGPGSMVASGWPPRGLAIAAVAVSGLALAAPDGTRRFGALLLATVAVVVYAPPFATGWAPLVLLLHLVAARAPAHLARAAWTVPAVVAAVAGVSAALGWRSASAWAVVAVGALVAALLSGVASRVTSPSAAPVEPRPDRDRVVLQERARIARELHDIVAHTVSVMVVQAEAADSVLDTDPGKAREALTAIGALGRRSMQEIRTLVGVLRTEGDPSSQERHPQPGLASLAALVDDMREAGLPVEIVTDGEPHDLPAGLDLSAYRIVQESLTNVLKHAGQVATVVRLTHRPSELRLEISNEGPVVSDTPGDGHGLVGMRERVALFDGRLDAGPRRRGGWRVAARLPVPSSYPSFEIRGRR